VKEIMIRIICKVCENAMNLLDLEGDLRSYREIKCSKCGRILVPKYKKW